MLGVIFYTFALCNFVCVPASANYNGLYKKDTKLNSYPLILSHDAASGELTEKRDHVVADWAQTQSVGLVGQLNCGSRSFDYRPYLKDDMLFAHHGGVVIHKPMEESLYEVLNWAADHANELVVFYISSWDGDGDCKEKSVELLTSMSIYTISECSALADLTYQNAVKMSKHALGGSVLAVLDCTTSNYDPSINCYGKDFVCYDSWPEGTADIPWEALKNNLAEVTAEDPTETSPNLWMTQAHWQSTAASVTLGTLHNSSLLLDESRAGVNKFILDALNARMYPYMNLLELDNVCNFGPEIHDALQIVYLD